MKLQKQQQDSQVGVICKTQFLLNTAILPGIVFSAPYTLWNLGEITISVNVLTTCKSGY